MERALVLLQTILQRRGMSDTKLAHVAQETLESANLYTIGNVLAIFNQKDKISERDIGKFLEYADANDYKNGIVIVGLSPPSDNVLKVIKTHTKNRVSYFNLRELQFDITTHRYYMPHRIVKEDEKAGIFEKFKIQDPPNQMPSIDSYDIQARLLGAVPGDIIEIMRHSDSVGRMPYYRYCVEDVNI